MIIFPRTEDNFTSQDVAFHSGQVYADARHDCGNRDTGCTLPAISQSILGHLSTLTVEIIANFSYFIIFICQVG